MRNALVILPVAAFAVVLAACAEAESEPQALTASAPAHAAWTPADEFLAELGKHCGNSYAGRVLADDDHFEDRVMILHVADCGPAGVRMPFEVADDHARALVVERTISGLHLHHEHYREDGVPFELSEYGGVSVADAGTALRQEFAPDPFTVAVLEQAGVNGASANRWVLEIAPGEALRYELQRADEQLVVIEFDLQNPVTLPDTPLEMHVRNKATGSLVKH